LPFDPEPEMSNAASDSACDPWTPLEDEEEEEEKDGRE
jgi:hypothetical protein